MSRAAQSIRVFLVLLLLPFAGCGRASKNDPIQAANSFFELLGRLQTKEAYDRTTFAFQAQQSFKNFEGIVTELGLVNYSSLTWKSMKVDANEAKLEGEVVTGDGEKIAVTLTLVKERGTWKVYGLQTPSTAFPKENRFSLVGKGAAFSDVFNKEIPPENQIREIVRDTLVRFNDAIHKKDFSDFYKSLSVSWQSQLSEKRLQRAFQPFIDAGVNISGVKDVEPEFDQPPKINSEGLLVASGRSPTKPYSVVFSLKFIYELPNWKLFGIDVNLEK